MSMYRIMRKLENFLKGYFQGVGHLTDSLLLY